MRRFVSPMQSRTFLYGVVLKCDRNASFLPFLQIHYFILGFVNVTLLDNIAVAKAGIDQRIFSKFFKCYFSRDWSTTGPLHCTLGKCL